ISGLSWLAARIFFKSVSFRIIGMSVEFTNSLLVSGLTEAPPQLAPPCAVGSMIDPSMDGGSQIPVLYLFLVISSLIHEEERPKNFSSYPWRANGGFTGIGCVGHGFSPGMLLTVSTGTSFTPNNDSPVSRSNRNRYPIFVTCATASISFPSRFIVTRLGGEPLSRSQRSWCVV